MERRTVIITGGNSGLGYQCAKNIAMKSKDYTVIIACRNLEKASVAKRSLQQETGNSNIFALELDLSSLDSIRKFYNIFCNEKYPPLYALVCNAGLTPKGIEYTKDGFEMAFGVNHLGHYLLANLIVGQIVDNGRIVFVSSGTHNPPKFFPYDTPVFTNAKQLAFPETNADLKQIPSTLRYATTKLCNILCAYEMASRITTETNKNITVNAFNPGIMTDTNLSSFSNPALRSVVTTLMNLFAKVIGRQSNSKKSGKILADLITESKYEGATGKYYNREKESNSSFATYDKTASKKLWIESAKLVKLQNCESIFSVNS